MNVIILFFLFNVHKLSIVFKIEEEDEAGYVRFEKFLAMMTKVLMERRLGLCFFSFGIQLCVSVVYIPVDTKVSTSFQIQAFTRRCFTKSISCLRPRGKRLSLTR
jgi:hypothetical protein